MKYVMLITCLLLVGCEDQNARDQCLRREIFKMCMQAPNGNPDDCDTAAGYQSIGPRNTIKPECRV